VEGQPVHRRARQPGAGSLTIDGDRVVDEERLLTDMRPRERIRDVVQGPDGALYLLTDNVQGRILKLIPE